MEKQGGVNDKEQYVGPKYVRDHLMVSRTKAYEIMREIENEFAPEAVVRIGRCLRVRKDVFFRWIDEQGAGGESSYTDPVGGQSRKAKALRLTG